MRKLTFLLPGLVLCLLGFSSAQAQTGLFPDEAQLNRLGLTMSWWGQAVLDPSRDKLQFLTADEQNVYAQGSSGIITGFQGEVGRRLWSQLLGIPDQQSFPASASDDQVFVAIGMNIYALNKTNGIIDWELRVPSHPSAAPSLDREQIYVGSVDGSVYTYDLAKVRNLYQRGMLPLWTERAFVWRFKAPEEITSSPIPLGLVVTFASEAGSVYGLGTKDKKLKFQFETDGRIFTPLGFSEQFVFVADTKSRTYCINQATGRVRWVYSSGSPLQKQPRPIGRQVFLLPHREGLACVSIDTGVTQWQHRGVTEFVACSENRVYASDVEGNLLILDRLTGHQIGSINLRRYSMRVSNDRTDRIIMGTSTGVVISLREIDSDLPVFHLHPERRPIMPLFAPDEDAAEPGAEAAAP